MGKDIWKKKTMKLKLRPYQKEGVQLIEKFKGRCLLADEMRLGKTPQVLYWLSKTKPSQVIVVCPSTAKWEWSGQAKKLINKNTQVLEGQKPYPITSNFVIINYDILQYWIDNLKKRNPDVLIFDEGHYLKNPKSLRFKAANRLSKGLKYLIGISGTPLVNRPLEVFNLITLINPKLFPSRWKFAMRYCKPKMTPWGWDFSGASHIEELSSKLRENLMIRRTRKEVWKDIQEKERVTVPLQIDNYKEYKEAKENFIEWLKNREPSKVKKALKAQTLVQIGKLTQLAAELKYKKCVDWIQDYLDDTDDKLIIFGIHKNILKPLHEKFKKISVLVDGSVKGVKRKQAQDKFMNNPKTRLFIGNIIATNTAIDLSAANAVVFIELDRVPGNHVQAEDRMISYDKKEGGVAYYLIAKDTIEEPICKAIQKKAKIIGEILDGEENREKFDIYDILIKSLMKENK